MGDITSDLSNWADDSLPCARHSPRHCTYLLSLHVEVFVKDLKSKALSGGKN